MRTTLALLEGAVIDQRPPKFFFSPSSWTVIIITYFRYGAGVALHTIHSFSLFPSAKKN